MSRKCMNFNEKRHKKQILTIKFMLIINFPVIRTNISTFFEKTCVFFVFFTKDDVEALLFVNFNFLN